MLCALAGTHDRFPKNWPRAQEENQLFNSSICIHLQAIKIFIFRVKEHLLQIVLQVESS